MFVLLLFLSLSASAVEMDEGDRVAIGDKIIVNGRRVHQTALVLDDQGTVYVMSVNGVSDESFLRISKPHVVEQFFVYRDTPFILDRHGRLYAFDSSWLTSLRNKAGYMSLRALKMVPVAVGTAAAAYGIGVADQAFLRYLSTDGVDFIPVLIGSTFIVYTLDIAYTALLRSHRSIGRGANFFTKLIAKGVTNIEKSEDHEDYLVDFKTGWLRKTQRAPLSKLASAFPRSDVCAEYLTKIGLP